MRKYENLFKYINYFNELNRQFATWIKQEPDEDGVLVFPFPDYKSELVDFIHEVQNSDLLHKDYINVLETNQFDVSNLNEFVEEADLELTRAVLTYLVREERFSDGAWETSAKEGYFLNVLKRLEELIK